MILPDSGRRSETTGACTYLPRPVAHSIGALSIVWSALAWGEWFLIPVLFPGREGPLPYADFMPLAIAFVAGCLIFVILYSAFSMKIGQRCRLVYLLAPLSYPVFHLVGFLMVITT